MRRRSRRIQQARLGEHLLAKPLVKRVARHEIDPAAEGGGEFVGEILNAPSQTRLRCQLIEQVDVAVGARVIPAHRSEDLESDHSVPPAHRYERLLVNRHSSDVHPTKATACAATGADRAGRDNA